MRRISWIDQGMRSDVLALRSTWFFWASACWPDVDERDVTMPAVPGSGFVVVEPELVFGCLEAILDRPAMALDADQGLDRSPCRTPGGEVGEIAVGDITPDQQASCPKDLVVMVGLFAFEIDQFEVAPVVQSRSFGSIPGSQTPPVRSSLRLCDLLGGADNPLRL